MGRTLAAPVVWEGTLPLREPKPTALPGYLLTKLHWNRIVVLTDRDYRAVFEASPDAMLIVDANGVIRDLNPQAIAMFGWSREEMEDSGVERLVPARDGRSPCDPAHHRTWIRSEGPGCDDPRRG
ncbi:PAS domain S-box protein [Candidatus Palauibacter sp.]|uniref:PAS domain S-box protein n=1 Tax=Candidatus Palauibacter sp. TaxID=3101350 RepID=UPI003B524F58